MKLWLFVTIEDIRRWPTGADTGSNCLIYIKSGNMIRKSREKSGKLSTKLGKIGTFT